MKSVFLHTQVAFSMVGVAFLLLTTPLWGAEKPVNLPDAISAALNSYGELRAAKEERGITEAAAVKAALYPNPVLELGGSTGALTGSKSENDVFVAISQEFVTGSKREKRSRIAERELVGFDNRITDAERLLRLEVKTVFHDLLLAESRVGLAQKAEDLNSQLLRISGERFAAGEVAEMDVNLSRVEAARAEGRTIDAERERSPVRQRLSLLMGLPLGEELRVSGPLDAGMLAADIEELKRQALESRHDQKALKVETDKTEVEVLLARAERIPNVTVGLAYSRERSLTSLGGFEDRSTDNLIGLRISVPIPLFDRNQAGQQQANARKNSAKSRYLFAMQSIGREVEAAHARLSSAQKAVALYRTGIMPKLEENLKLIQDAYQLGEVGILAVIEEQKKYIEVNDSYLNALYNWNIAVAKLEAAVGVELKKEDGGSK